MNYLLEVILEKLFELNNEFNLYWSEYIFLNGYFIIYLGKYYNFYRILKWKIIDIPIDVKYLYRTVIMEINKHQTKCI